MCLEADVPGTLRLRSTLHPRGPAAAVLLTEAQVTAIAGAAKTPPVRVTVNGHTFAGRIGRRGDEILLGFSRAVREAAGVAPGDEIELVVALDDQPREVEVPEPLAEALAGDGRARAAFEALSFTRRKEMARGIAEAKRRQTRDKRVADALAQLR